MLACVPAQVATLLYLTLSNQGNPKPPTCTVEAAMARQVSGCHLPVPIRLLLFQPPRLTSCCCTPQALPRGNLTSLADRRPLPQEFADPAAVFEEEGPTYRWLFQLLENTHVFTPCADDAAAQLVIPDGWQEVAR